MRAIAALFVALTCAIGAGEVSAKDRRDDRGHRESRGHHGDHGRSPGRNDRIAREAQRQTGGGRVLSVQPSEFGHRVKLLKDGEVHVLTVPENDFDSE
jgi:hypothetical protein